LGTACVTKLFDTFFVALVKKAYISILKILTHSMTEVTGHPSSIYFVLLSLRVLSTHVAINLFAGLTKRFSWLFSLIIKGRHAFSFMQSQFEFMLLLIVITLAHTQEDKESTAEVKMIFFQFATLEFGF